MANKDERVTVSAEVLTLAHSLIIAALGALLGERHATRCWTDNKRSARGRDRTTRRGDVFEGRRTWPRRSIWSYISSSASVNGGSKLPNSNQNRPSCFSDQNARNC